MAVLQATSITGGLTMHGMAAGFMKVDASGSVTMDTNTYATTSALSSYLALTGGTMTGTLAINSGGVHPLAISSGQRYQLQVRNTNNSINSGYGWWWFMDTNFNMGFHADGAADRLTLTRDGNFSVSGTISTSSNIETTSGSSYIRVSGISSGSYIEISGNLPGYSNGVYPVIKSGGTIHFANNGKYSAYLEANDTYFGIMNSSQTTKVLLHTNGASYLTGGVVGIGLNNPSSGDRLEVVGALRVHTGNNWDAIQIYTDGANGYIQGLGDETGLRIRSEYGNVLLADNRGVVGIGTSSPTAKLHVYTGNPSGSTGLAGDTAIAIDSSGNQFLEFRTSSSSSGIMQGLLFTDNGRNAFIGFKEYTGAAAATYGESIQFAIYDYSGSDAGSGFWWGTTTNAVNGITSPLMFLRSNGNLNVGFGSDNGFRLSVSGTGYASSDFRAPIFYDSQNTAYYLDPASTSNLNGLTVGGSSVVTNNGGTWGINISGNAATATNASQLGGWTVGQIVPYHSGSDFPNGTLVVTNINSSVTSGDSFVMELTGKSYQTGNSPFGLLLQGYIYADTFINCSAMSYGTTFPNVVILNYGGNLAFWWPRISYWNSFSVTVREAGGSSYNRVTSISDSTEPSSAKKVTVSPFQVVHSGNIGSQSVSYASSAGNADTVDGYHASGLWKLNEWNGNIYAHTDGRVYGTIFYDANDSGYYLDPNSQSNLLRIKTNTNWYDNSASDWGGGVNMSGNNPSIGFQPTSSSWWYMLHHSTYMNFYRRNTSGSWNQDGIWDTSGNLIWSNSMRAPIFYDSDNTAYYLDPASTSNLNGLQVGGSAVVTNNGGTWNINVTGTAGSASSASSVPWTGVSSGARTNYNLRFQPFSGDYAGFEFNTSSGGGGGYFLIRGGSDNDVYTAEGITLVADAGWLTLAQRTQSNKGVRIMTGATSTTRLQIDSSGNTDISLGAGTVTLYHGGSARFWTGSDGTRTQGWSYFQNTSQGLHWPGNNWHLHPASASDFIIRSGSNTDSALRFDTNGTTRGYVYSENDNTLGFLTNTRNWALRVYSDANIVTYGHYLTVGQNKAWSSILMHDSDEGTREIHCNSNRIGFLTQGGSWGAYLDDGTNWYAEGSMRAPIFYDSNDTGYYLDPSSTGTSLYVAGSVQGSYYVASNYASTGYTQYKGYDNNNHFIMIRGRVTGNTTTPTYTGYHRTSLVEYAESNDDTGWFFQTAATGNYDIVARITRSYSQFEGSVRAPIFYDSQDTGYFCDPNSRSRLSSIDYGSSGYYFAAGDWGWRHNTPSGWIQFGPANSGHAHIYTDRSNFYFNVDVMYQNGNRIYGDNYRPYADSAGNADTVDGFHAAAFPYRSGGSSGYYQVADWMQFNTTAGLYWPSYNGAHIYPNTSTSYGSIKIDGSRNGWRGINFDGAVTLMMNNNETGFYRDGYGWQWRWENGTAYVHKNGQGGGTSATVLDSSNYTSYAPSTTGSGASGTWSINISGTAARATRANGNFYIDDNYGNTIVGVYASTRYQGVFAMGDSYKLPADGTGPGNLYGLAWSHPNAGGVAGNLNDHGLLVLINGGFAAAISSSIRAASDMRAPIFYDSNDTSYYLDPNGTSELAQLTTGTRARWGKPRWWNNRQAFTSDQNYWTGTNGWGTGEGTWANAWKGGFSGWDIWGSSSDHPQGSGYIHAQGIVSGQHYASSDGGSGYGWMMVGAADATGNRYWLRGKWGGSTSSWTEMMTSNNNPYAWNMNQYVRTSDNVEFNGVTVRATITVGSWGNSSSIYMVDNDEGTREIHCNSNRIGFLTQAGSWGAWLDDSNNWFAGGSMRSPYFYDSNNTGYYGVFSGTSRMYRIDADYLYSYDWVYAQGDIIAYYSDERLKTKVGGIENALDKIKQLNGFYYVNNELANSFGYTDTKVQVGLSAQEVKAVLPEVVTLAAFDTEFDENQKPIGSKSGEDYLTVNYDKLVPLLIEAIKEQQKQIDELKARLN